MDAFWSSSTGEVHDALDNIKYTIELLSPLGLTGSYYDSEPTTSDNTFGYMVMICVWVLLYARKTTQIHASNGVPCMLPSPCSITLAGREIWSWVFILIMAQRHIGINASKLATRREWESILDRRKLIYREVVILKEL